MDVFARWKAKSWPEKVSYIGIGPFVLGLFILTIGAMTSDHEMIQTGNGRVNTIVYQPWAQVAFILMGIGMSLLLVSACYRCATGHRGHAPPAVAMATLPGGSPPAYAGGALPSPVVGSPPDYTGGALTSPVVMAQVVGTGDSNQNQQL